ncbi:MAG: caspase family protein, partial [Hyphomonas sp.]|nr:caspase family protein [Hyphomonas sp.]
IGTLANPVNDARLIADAITNCSFSLVTGGIVQDAGRSALMGAIRQFADELKTAGPEAIGFLYYSGHGAAREGQGNFLIPVEDAAVLDEALWDDSVSLDWVMGKLSDCDAPVVVAIDACRNVLKLPEAQRALGAGESFRGLRRTDDGADERNMFISFATWEGETASDGRADDGNGPYAKSLGERLAAPAVTVRDMFEQVRLDVLEKTLQRQEPMNLSRLQRRSTDIMIGSAFKQYDDSLVWQDRPPLRHAIVFSNTYSASYGHALASTDEDGRKVTEALNASGFVARQVHDADRTNFLKSLDHFRSSLNRAGPASVGVVYLAGYGASINGDNYFVPEGPLPESESDVQFDAIAMRDIVEYLENSAAQAIVILFDCGRPFDTLLAAKGFEPGFASFTTQSKVVIGYGDAPGTVREHGSSASPFAEAFARQIQSEDRIDIESVMNRVTRDVMLATGSRQSPWYLSSLQIPIYFREEIAADDAGPPSMTDPF